MPQTGRKVAFSAKQKKKQLQEKKERKANQEKNEYGDILCVEYPI